LAIHVTPVIPGKSNRKKRIRHDKSAYKNRNVYWAVHYTEHFDLSGLRGLKHEV
jgi:hypothetical protein